MKTIHDIMMKFFAAKSISMSVFDKIGRKRFASILRNYCHIELDEYFFDDQEYIDNENPSWIDVEGEGYGFFWQNFKTHKEMSKGIKKWVLDLFSNSTMYGGEKDGVYYFLIENDNSINVVRLSNKKFNSCSYLFLFDCLKAYNKEQKELND